MRKALVLLSGGMDSATALALALSMGGEAEAVSFDYGQRHSKELDYAAELAKAYGVKHTVLDLSGASAAFEGSALTSDIDVPLGHYEDESMKQTVVPNRNMIMLSLAAGLAISRGLDDVMYAAHSGDHAIYPDCRPEFASAVALAISLGNYDAPTLVTPFIRKTKADIAREGARLGVPFELTWSCYLGEKFHCGACGTCTERREAFELAGVTDPTVYVDL